MEGSCGSPEDILDFKSEPDFFLFTGDKIDRLFLSSDCWRFLEFRHSFFWRFALKMRCKFCFAESCHRNSHEIFFARNFNIPLFAFIFDDFLERHWFRWRLAILFFYSIIFKQIFKCQPGCCIFLGSTSSRFFSLAKRRVSKNIFVSIFPSNSQISNCWTTFSNCI